MLFVKYLLCGQMKKPSLILSSIILIKAKCKAEAKTIYFGLTIGLCGMFLCLETKFIWLLFLNVMQLSCMALPFTYCMYKSTLCIEAALRTTEPLHFDFSVVFDILDMLQQFQVFMFLSYIHHSQQVLKRGTLTYNKTALRHHIYESTKMPF